MLLVLSVLFINVTVFAKGTEIIDEVTFNKVDIYLDLNEINANSLTYKNVTYIPLREISETLGLEVEFNKNTQAINLTSSGEVSNSNKANEVNDNTKDKAIDKTVKLKLDSVNIYVDNEFVEASNIIYNGTTYVPLRAISDVLGVEVKYEPQSSIVFITSPKSNNKPSSKVEENTQFKPLLTKEDIDYPAQPKTVEDFEKVLLYMGNSNIDNLRLLYYGNIDSLFRDNTEIYENLSIAFQNVSVEYVDLFSGASEYRVSANERDNKVVVTIEIIGTYYENEDVISGQKKFEEEAKNINDFLIDSSVIRSDMTEREIAKLLYSYVTVMLEYDIDTYNDINENNEAYTGYGAVMNNKAVCQGYTALYNYLLKLNGIECYGQAGVVDGSVPHIWTVAMLDGEKTYIDVTFGDPVPDRKGYTNYKYFDISKEELSKDRTGVE